MAAVFRDPAKGRYLIAEADGRAVACTLLIPEWSDWRNATVLWVHSVYVVPAFRRRGVFRAIYSHLRAAVEGTRPSGDSGFSWTSETGLRSPPTRRSA